MSDFSLWRALPPHAPEHAVLKVQEHRRRVELAHSSIGKHKDAIRVNDRVQTMGDCEHSHIFELLSNHSLNHLVHTHMRA
jgi:hypothetical protein